jgi:hypothetical protein
MTLPKNLGILLLAIWLILYGALHFIKITVDMGAVMAVLAIVAGVLLLMQR